MNLFISFGIGALLLGFAYLILNYAKGLKDSPKEIWYLFLVKLIEYAAYGASNMTFVLYLSSDCGLGDIAAGSYIGTWSMFLTLFSALVGSVIDEIGIKKTLIFGLLALLLGRAIMPFSTNLFLVTLFSFFPLAIGNALLGPVLSVGIKKYTSRESISLGFGLFYTIMNVGFALGGYIFDKVREIFGEHKMISISTIGVEMSTYQVIFLVCFFITIPSLAIVFLMQEKQSPIPLHIEEKPDFELKKNFFQLFVASILNIYKTMKKVVLEKSFWHYILLLGVLVFVKLVFYHFHYTFPKYGIRVFGEGIKIGNIYGILNPVLIIFLVPFVSHFTKKVSSYRMMLFGTMVSTLSIFFATLPAGFFQSLESGWIWELIFVHWLDLEPGKQNPLILGLILFIFFFSIGEAIWSPRLMQFSTEIAPEGKEGTYVALSYLPYFLAKIWAGPLSGWLVSTYAPQDVGEYPDHYMLWVWIGMMSAISPLGLFLFRKSFLTAQYKTIQ